MNDQNNQKPESQTPALRESEWAFHLVPEEEICACAHWELARHRGETKPPWRDLPTEQRATQSVSPFFHELPLEKQSLISAILMSLPPVSYSQPARIYIVQVNFIARDESLIEGFRRWLNTHPERKDWQARKLNKTPNHRPWRKWLLDIATYRSKKAGLKRKEALELMWPLFVAWNVTKKNGRISAPHWRHALKRAEKLASWTKVSSRIRPVCP